MAETRSASDAERRPKVRYAGDSRSPFHSATVVIGCRGTGGNAKRTSQPRPLFRDPEPDSGSGLSADPEPLGDLVAADGGDDAGVADHHEKVGGAGHADAQALAGPVAGAVLVEAQDDRWGLLHG